MAQEQLIEVLTEAGAEKADIDALIALTNPAADAKPEDLEAHKKALEPFITKILGNTATKIKNDAKFWEGLDENNVNEAFKKKIEAQQYGRASNISRTKIMQGLGYTDADITDMPEEDKKNLEVFAKKLAEKFSANKATDKEMQKELVAARQKLETLEADIPVKEEKIKQDAQKQFDAEKLNFIVLAALSGVKGLKVKPSLVVKQITEELLAENHFVVDGWKAAPKQKDKPTLDVLDGSKVLTLEDLVNKKLIAEDLLEKEDADEKKKTGIITKVDITPKDGTLQMSGHVAEMLRQQEEAAKKK